MALKKTLQALLFLGLFATSCLAQAPAPAPITLLPPPVASPSPVTTPSPVASPPVPVNEPTPAPATPPTVSPPKASPVASPPKHEGLAPGAPSGTTPAPAPSPRADAPAEADSALTNKAFLVSTVIAGALYAVVLA